MSHSKLEGGWIKDFNVNSVFIKVKQKKTVGEYLCSLCVKDFLNKTSKARIMTQKKVFHEN